MNPKFSISYPIHTTRGFTFEKALYLEDFEDIGDALDRLEELRRRNRKTEIRFARIHPAREEIKITWEGKGKLMNLLMLLHAKPRPLAKWVSTVQTNGTQRTLSLEKINATGRRAGVLASLEKGGFLCPIAQKEIEEGLPLGDMDSIKSEWQTRFPCLLKWLIGRFVPHGSTVRIWFRSSDPTAIADCEILFRANRLPKIVYRKFCFGNRCGDTHPD